MIKNYNSNRLKLELPEYGRNILQMVDSLKNTNNRERRNEMAHTIISVMGNINPTLRDSSDYRHKLWDHLFIMADFDLDIDSPYPIPDRDTLYVKPQRLSYPQKSFSHKQYGKNIRKLIDAVGQITNPEHKEIVVADIAKFMKIKSFEYKREYPSDEVIISDLINFSNNTIDVSSDVLTGTKISTSLRSLDQLNSYSQSSTKSNNKPLKSAGKSNGKSHSNLSNPSAKSRSKGAKPTSFGSKSGGGLVKFQKKRSVK